MVLKDRLLFMFSSKNPDRLCEKPSFVMFFMYMITFLFLLFWPIILYSIVYIIEEFLLFRELTIIDILNFIGIVYYGIFYMCGIALIIIAIRFLIQVKKDIELAFKPHEEIFK